MQSEGSQLSRDSFSEIDISSPLCKPILAYPGHDASDISGRISELESLGIRSLVSGGRTSIGRFRVCGKGYVGLVVMAVVRSGPESAVCALKVRRTDADRINMHDEARLHGIANAACVGPQLRGCTDNFLLMDFVNGSTIMEWSQGTVKPDSARRIAKSILVQCRRLDKAGIDHGELSRLDRHVIIPTQSAGTDHVEPVIIDFESSSTVRRPANVSAAAQALFVGGRQFIRKKMLPHASKRLDDAGTQEAIAAIRAYKKDLTDENFERVLDVLLGGTQDAYAPS